MVLPQVHSKEIIDGLEDELPPSKIRIFLTALLGVFLILLIALWTFSDVLQGIAQSSVVRENILYAGDASFVFQNGTLERLQDEFVANQDREIKACLFGRVYGSAYYIEGISFPEIIRANVLHVVSVRCPIDAIVDVHSHPINKCLASEQDLSVYRELKERNPLVRLLVMCSLQRFGSI